MSASPLYVLLEDRLMDRQGVTLADYVAKHKPAKSWRTMAAELSETTGATVTHETLRTWFADRITVELKVS